MARSAKKGPFVDESLLNKVQKIKHLVKEKLLKLGLVEIRVLPEFVGLTLSVHDGRKFVSVYVTENMVGHKLGEFAPTRTFRLHSGQRKTGVAEQQ